MTSAKKNISGTYCRCEKNTYCRRLCVQTGTVLTQHVLLNISTSLLIHLIRLADFSWNQHALFICCNPSSTHFSQSRQSLWNMSRCVKNIVHSSLSAFDLTVLYCQTMFRSLMVINTVDRCQVRWLTLSFLTLKSCSVHAQALEQLRCGFPQCF